MNDASQKINQFLKKTISERKELGLQAAAYLDGRLVIDSWAGWADEASKREVNSETLFTSFSISKGITATCIHLLAEKGLVEYDLPVAHYWPEFAGRGKGGITIRHVLTHKAGIPEDPPELDIEKLINWDAVISLTAEMEPLWEPGTRTGYHPLTYGWILGEVVRRISGQSISEFLQAEICRPLDIEGLFFGVPANLEPRVATLKNAPGYREYIAKFGLPLNHPLNDTAATFNRSDIRQSVIPGAGAIVNARSLARFYAMLACGGKLNNRRILSEEIINSATSPVPENPEKADIRWWYRHGLGYTLGGGPGPRERMPNAFGYEGIGTIGFADPDRKFSFAFLRNLLGKSDPGEFLLVKEVLEKIEEVLGLTLSR